MPPVSNTLVSHLPSSSVPKEHGRGYLRQATSRSVPQALVGAHCPGPTVCPGSTAELKTHLPMSGRGGVIAAAASGRTLA
jgi:hypothetical protein